MITGFGSGTGFVPFALASIIFALGTSPVFTLTTDLIIGAAPPERAGAASAMSETSAEFGGALGIAVFGSIGVAVYRSVMADASLPNVSAEVARAAAATLGGAVEVAGQLPAEAGDVLKAAARIAFVRGLRLCAAISAIASIALAVFAWFAFRHPRESAETNEAPATSKPELGGAATG
jgi:MFS transporter, DHA2 family, multidrug resistance protein